MRVFISLLISIFLVASFNPGHVKADTKYTYELMVSEIKRLKKEHPNLIDYHSLGKTDFNRNVWAVKLGHGKKVVFLNGSHHAREWMTTQLLMKMIEEYANAYKKNARVGKYNAYDILHEYTIWFVPMVNPDGVTLQQKGLSAFPKSMHSKLIAMNEGSKNFTRWKANANGVDLNRQYPANWNSPTGVNKPSWAGYKGKKPFQEKEVQYIRDFTYKIKPDIATAYHSSGEILYWYFHNKYKSRDYQLAKELSNITGYKLVPSAGYHSGKGYTDWFIQEFHLPGFTPEISPWINNGPVPQKYFPKIWGENKTVGLWMASRSADLFHNEKSDNINAKIKLEKIYSLYTSPSFESITWDQLSPQVVSLKKKQGNWYLVKTYVGDRWIYVPTIDDKLYGQYFLDVPESFWAKDAVDYAYENKYMIGTGGVYFQPNKSLTRAQAAVVLARMMELESPNNTEPSFNDVSTKHWAFNEIESVKEHDLMVGIGDGKFNPDSYISRQEMATLVANLFKEEIVPATEKPFEDVDLSLWSADAISFVKDKGIFIGSNGQFNPLDNLTRAEYATIIKRLKLEHLDKIEEEPESETPEEEVVIPEDENEENNENGTDESGDLPGEQNEQSEDTVIEDEAQNDQIAENGQQEVADATQPKEEVTDPETEETLVEEFHEEK